METKLSLFNEVNRDAFTNSMNEIHDLKLTFDQWLEIATYLPSQVDFFYGINSQQITVKN